MPDVTKTTTIGGIRYDMKLLGADEAIAIGVLVAGPGLRAVDELVAGAAALSKLFDRFTALRKEGKGVDELGWDDFTALKDAHIPLVVARAIEALGGDGVAEVARAFTAQTTVHLPSPVPGGGIFPVPLANADDHWKGKFPLFMAWLTWGVWANGFFDVSGLLDKLTVAAKAAAELSKSPRA
jgi:hypothetical protein